MRNIGWACVIDWALSSFTELFLHAHKDQEALNK